MYRQERLIRPSPNFVDDVMPVLLNRDDTHLSCWGNRVYTMAVFMPLLHKWLSYPSKEEMKKGVEAVWGKEDKTPQEVRVNSKEKESAGAPDHRHCANHSSEQAMTH